jgi:hypothetical protein
MAQRVIYSILISCRRRGLQPEEYLTDVPALDENSQDPRTAPRSVATSLSEYLLKTGSSFGLLLWWS